MPDRRRLSLFLVAPALAMVLALFVYPLGYSLVSAFTARDGQPTLNNFAKTFDLYRTDILFTVVIVAVSTVLTGLFAAVIGGYLVLGAHPAAGRCSSRSSSPRNACAPSSPRTAC